MTRALLIIPSDQLASARAMAMVDPFNLSEAEADQLFVMAGSPTGQLPATHYWASGIFTPEQWSAIQQLAASLPWAEAHEYNQDVEINFPWERLTALGLQAINLPLP
jgi:hypothetical protein